MRYQFCSAFLVLVSLTLVQCKVREDHDSDFHSESKILGPTYENLFSGHKTLANQFPKFVSLHVYGKSIGGLPLYGLRIGDQTTQATPSAPTRLVLITDATHGNEYTGIVSKLPQWFVQNREQAAGAKKFFDQGGALFIVPIVNPDGYNTRPERKRRNRNDADLNRDFSHLPTNTNLFTQPESTALAAHVHEFVRRSRDLQLAMDYHCCNGSILYPWTFTSEVKLPKNDFDAHLNIARIMQDKLGTEYKHGLSSGVIKQKGNVGISKDYYYSKYRALAFTFEGQRTTEFQNFAQHTQMWNGILGYLASGRRDQRDRRPINAQLYMEEFSHLR